MYDVIVISCRVNKVSPSFYVSMHILFFPWEAYGSSNRNETCNLYQRNKNAVQIFTQQGMFEKRKCICEIIKGKVQKKHKKN